LPKLPFPAHPSVEAMDVNMASPSILITPWEIPAVFIPSLLARVSPMKTVKNIMATRIRADIFVEILIITQPIGKQ
jgi:hypothetical protein